MADQEPAADLPRASYPLRLNGVEVAVDEAWIGESLLWVLRERLGLPAAKQGCDVGECGVCTVLVDGRPAAACLMPAVAARDRDVRTVEGFAAAGDALPARVGQAVAAVCAARCGFCVPGLVVTASALLARSPRPSAGAVREALSGNPCRCVSVSRIVAAVLDVATADDAYRPADPVTGEVAPVAPGRTAAR
jgi:aerobic-type carbon monoxide dehydrogenase small subunit (CoxS/CutS family)